MANSRPYIISKAIAGDASTDIVMARSDVDVMRALLMSDYSEPRWTTYAGAPKVDRIDGYPAVLALMTSGKDSYTLLTPQDTAIFANARDRSNEQIVASLPDAVIEKLFEFVFTGGYGEQSGIPGKEWKTITVTAMPAHAPSIYDRFDAARHEDAGLKNLFSALGGRSQQMGQSVVQPMQQQPLTFQPSLSPAARSPTQARMQPPKRSDRQIIEDIVDGIEEAFLEGNYEGNYDTRGLIREIEKLAIQDGQVDRSVFDRERDYANAYIRRAALRILSDDDVELTDKTEVILALADADHIVEFLKWSK